MCKAMVLMLIWVFKAMSLTALALASEDDPMDRPVLIPKDEYLKSHCDVGNKIDKSYYHDSYKMYRCQDNYFRVTINHDSKTFQCKACSSCPEGEVISRECDCGQDSICCPQGFGSVLYYIPQKYVGTHIDFQYKCTKDIFSTSEEDSRSQSISSGLHKESQTMVRRLDALKKSLAEQMDTLQKTMEDMRENMSTMTMMEESGHCLKTADYGGVIKAICVLVVIILVLQTPLLLLLVWDRIKCGKCGECGKGQARITERNDFIELPTSESNPEEVTDLPAGNQ